MGKLINWIEGNIDTLYQDKTMQSMFYADVTGKSIELRIQMKSKAEQIKKLRLIESITDFVEELVRQRRNGLR